MARPVKLINMELKELEKHTKRHYVHINGGSIEFILGKAKGDKETYDLLVKEGIINDVSNNC
jgi:hypothetical protein